MIKPILTKKQFDEYEKVFSKGIFDIQMTIPDFGVTYPKDERTAAYTAGFAQGYELARKHFKPPKNKKSVHST